MVQDGLRHEAVGRGRRAALAWLTLLMAGAGLWGCDRTRPGPPGASASPPPNVPGAAAGRSARLQPGDLAYQGAFRLPEAFDWGARGMAFVAGPVGGALLVLGPDQQPAAFARIGIPTPARARAWAQLPVATMQTALRSFDGSIVEGVNEVAPFGSGIEVVPRQGAQQSDKLYGSLDNWYGVVEESHRAVWMAELDGSRPRGPFHVGPRREPFHGNKVGAFLFTVPRWYADAYLGGRTLVTGKARGAFHGSQGPSLFAFRPWNSEAPAGELDAVAMLYYRIRFPECAGPNVGDKQACDFPGFTMCDEWEGGSFVEHGSKRAVLLLGKKGLGPNHYGEPPRAGTCEGDKGYHCDPYERQVLLYDVDELGAAALGQRSPWTVRPYAVWRPGELLVQGRTCAQVGGMTTDPATRRLFVIEKGLGENNGAAVHVWTLR